MKGMKRTWSSAFLASSIFNNGSFFSNSSFSLDRNSFLCKRERPTSTAISSFSSFSIKHLFCSTNSSSFSLSWEERSESFWLASSNSILSFSSITLSYFSFPFPFPFSPTETQRRRIFFLQEKKAVEKPKIKLFGVFYFEVNLCSLFPLLPFGWLLGRKKSSFFFLSTFFLFLFLLLNSYSFPQGRLSILFEDRIMPARW